jgi:hypothetical protein
MSKCKLVVVGTSRQWSFSNLPHFLLIINQYIEFEQYQEDKTYDANTVFLIMGSSYNAEVAKRFEDQRVIIDLCVEGLFGKWGEIYKIKSPNHCIFYGSYIQNPPDDVVSVANFFWYNEALGNISKGYNTSYIPSKNFTKKFLMPIGAKREWRDHVVERFDPYLNDAYWSYVRRGAVLPGEPPATKYYDQRYLNPMWYDDTCFSVVVESYNGRNLVPDVPVFVTEKTFKPIAGHQPFMIIGGSGVLKYLRSQEFQTYYNIFDETYDAETDFDKKLDIIIDNIERYTKEPYSTKTLKRIKHNFKLFYDLDVIYAGIVKDIVEPIIKFIER